MPQENKTILPANAFSQLEGKLDAAVAKSATDFPAALTDITRLGEALVPEVQRENRKMAAVAAITVLAGVAMFPLMFIALETGSLIAGIGCLVCAFGAVAAPAIGPSIFGETARRDATKKMQDKFRRALSKMQPHAAVQDMETVGFFTRLCRRLGCGTVAHETKTAARMDQLSTVALADPRPFPAVEGAGALPGLSLPALDGDKAEGVIQARPGPAAAKRMTV